MTQEMGIALDLMRLEGICKMLLESIESDELEDKFLAATQQNKVDNLRNALFKSSKFDLRKIIEMSPAITEDVVKKYYNEYRYGRKPGFVLFWASGFIGKTLSEYKLCSDLQSALTTKQYNEDAKFKNLQCVAATKWVENNSTVLEIGLNYLKKYSYITANNNFSYIHELTDCFAWINVEKGFVALYNMPPTIEAIIRQVVLSLYGVKLLGLSLNRTILDTIFNPESRKKVSLTHYNSESSKPQKVTFSDPDFASKQDAVLADYDGYDIASSLYNEGIDDETTAILGINSNRGKLYINKNLTTTQFRQWSIRRINTIIDYFADIFSADGLEKIEHIQLFNSGEWGKLRLANKEILNELAKSILICKQKGLSSYPVNISASALVHAFPQKVEYCFLFNCDSCNETNIPMCVKCGSSSFSLVKGNNILCHGCGDQCSTFKCECGQTTDSILADNILSVTLKDNFTAEIIRELQVIAPALTFAETEYIALQGGHLRLMCSDGFKRLLPNDIATFSFLYSFDLDQNEVSRVKTLLGSLKEKCTEHPTNEMCQSCKYARHTNMNELKCIQQLFCVFSDFTPKPHQGQEYGDISITISLEGRTDNLQGVMKSQTSKITRSSATGREIIDQVIKGLLDARTGIIAVIAPALIDDQLIETLLTLAKRFNKRVIFLDADFMYRLYVAYKNSMLSSE